MSVVKGYRTESDMEFLKNARDIEEMLIDLRINKPKRYTFFFDRLLDLSVRLLTELKIGNSWYPQNQVEKQQRINHFKESLGICQALVSQVDVIQHKLKEGKISAGDVQILAEKLTEEIRLIKGVIRADKQRYKKLPTGYSIENLKALLAEHNMSSEDELYSLFEQ